jgi:hypothetical protein
MTLITWNGGPIFRDGAVATEQACCCNPPPPPPCEPPGVEYGTYSYDDTVPPAPDFCDCNCYGGCDAQNSPDFGQVCPDVDNPCTESSCCGEELVCYVRSPDFPAAPGCEPRATVFQGALFDDHGTIEGQDRTVTLPDPCVVNTPSEPLPTRPLPQSETLVPFLVDNGDGTVYLKLNLVVKNGEICGPYGVISMTVAWFFE